MLIEANRDFCKASGTFMELQFLRDMLTFPSDDDLECILDNENRFLSGLLPYVESKLQEVNHPYEVKGTPPIFQGELHDTSEDLLPEITLRDYQTSSVNKLLYCQRGIVSIAGGGGKTEIAVACHSMLSGIDSDHRTIFTVNRTRLADQAVERFKKYGFTDVGVVDGDRKEFDCEVTVALIPTLARGIKRGDKDVMRLLNNCNLIVFDEAHHLPAATWFLVGSVSDAEYKLALTATPFENSMNPETSRDYMLIGIAGPVILFMDVPSLVKRGILARPLVTMLNPKLPFLNNTWDWDKVYKRGVVDSSPRNRSGCNLAMSLFKQGYKVLILVQRVNHGKNLIKLLHSLGYEDPIFSYGGDSYLTIDSNGIEQELDWNNEKVYNHLEGSSSYVFIGSSVYDQGIDIPSLNSLIVMSGMKKLRTTLQRAYRAMRAKESDIGNTALIFDYYDQHHPFLLKQSKTRQELYENTGFEVYNDGRVLEAVLSKS